MPLKESNPIHIQIAQVVGINRSNWTCTVQPEGGNPIPDVPINPIYIGTEGNGIYYLPEPNSTVWLAQVGDGLKYHILMGASVPFDKDDVEAEDIDASMGRPELEPGDIMLSGTTGSHVKVQDNGVIEIGAANWARRYYLPLQDFVRDFCKSYEMLSAGGEIRFSTNEKDSRWGTFTANVVTDPHSPDGVEDVTVNKSPTKFELKVKEFQQDKEPVIELQMGRVDLDDESHLVGSLDWDDIVFEMLVQSPNPDISQQDGEKKGGRIRVLMDKRGTINSTFFGSRATVIKEDDILEAGNIKHKSVGLYKLSAQAKDVTIEGSDNYTVNGLAKRVFNNGVDISVKGQIKLDLSQPLNLITGERKDNVDGSFSMSVLGTHGTDITRDHEVSVGGSSKEVCSGQKTIEAGNKINPSPTGMLLKTYGGKLKLETFPGNGAAPHGTGIDLKTPMTRMVLDDVGNCYLRSGGGCTLQVSKTGAGISNGKGQQISIDQKGKINLGVPFAVGQGNIVTTITHPVCYVTGLPIKGSDQVTAYSINPVGMPGPSTPGTFVDAMAAAEAAIAAADIADKLV